MYFPSAIVLEKTLNGFFEMYRRQEMQNYALTGLVSLYSTQEMKNGKLDLAWLGDVPAVRKWKGSKLYGDLSEFSYSITSQDFYDGFSIHKKSLRHDDLSGIEPRVQQLAVNILNYESELVLAALVAGTTGLAYDGAAFFSNRSVNDNLAAGTGVTLATLTADIATVRRTMQRFLTDKGRYTRRLPDTVICPSELEPLFLQIKNSTDDPTSTNRAANPWGSMVKNVITFPDLTDTNDWYYASTMYPVKPFIYGYERLDNGQRVLPVLDTGKLASDGVYGYSAEMSGVAGYGDYTLMVKVVNG